MRHSSQIVIAALAGALAGIAGGCSQQVLVVVGPDPCADGGIASSAPGCVPPGLLDALVGYWRLDDGAGSATANDSSGRGNRGTLINLTPATAWVAGRAAGGLAVEAAGFVNVDASVSIDSITDQVTIAGWAYLEGSIVEYATVASREIRDTIDQHYHISIDAMGLPVSFVMTEGDGVRLTTPAAVTRGSWLHIAGTYDGRVARLYVDGREVASEPLAGRFAPDTTPVILGGNGNGDAAGPTELFPGRIDEVMLYRRALAPEEIAQLYAGALFAPAAAPDAGARD